MPVIITSRIAKPVPRIFRLCLSFMCDGGITAARPRKRADFGGTVRARTLHPATMVDVQTAPALPAVTRRDDYRPPDWLVPEIALDLSLDPALTRVRSVLHIVRNGDHDRPLRLDGNGQTPLSVTVDGNAINDWSIEDGALVIPIAGSAHTIETELELAPERNTQLMGLYA